MNREWRRVPTDCYCGYCGTARAIAKGEPALFVMIGQIRRPFVRCQDCAAKLMQPSAPPPDLPPLHDAGGIVPALFAAVGTASKHTVTRKQWMPYREAGEEG